MALFDKTTIAAAVDTGPRVSRTDVDKLFLTAIVADIEKGLFSTLGNTYPELFWDTTRRAFAWGQGVATAPDLYLQRADANTLELIDAANTTRQGFHVGNMDLDGYQDLAEIGTPANPAADHARLYSKDDTGTTKLYFRDSAGAETALGVSTLGDLTDVTVSGITTGELIKWNGSAWVNQTLFEANIGGLSVASVWTANQTLNDSVIHYYGTGSDAAVYHSGTNFYVQTNSAAGNMYLRTLTHGGFIYMQGEDDAGTNQALLYLNGQHGLELHGGVDDVISLYAPTNLQGHALTNGTIDTSLLTTGTLAVARGGTGVTGDTYDADMVDGYHATAYNVFTASACVTRHASGYIWSNYFNMTADVTTGTPTHIAIETTSDAYLRWQTPAQFKTNLSLQDAIIFQAPVIRLNASSAITGPLWTAWSSALDLVDVPAGASAAILILVPTDIVGSCVAVRKAGTTEEQTSTEQYASSMADGSGSVTSTTVICRVDSNGDIEYRYGHANASNNTCGCEIWVVGYFP